MNAKAQINEFISNQPEPKRSDMQALHEFMLRLLPSAKLWFLDGKNEDGKQVTNPNVGYGVHIIKYKDGSTREFYQVGFSPNTTGISVNIMSIKDKTFLADTYGKTMGKASMSGYCIKFKKLKDINLEVLEDAIKYGAALSNFE